MSILSDEFYYQHINLDTVNTQVFTNLTSKVGDTNGRGLIVTLTENGLQKDTTGISLNLKWKHRSVVSQGLDNFDVVDLSKGVYKITYPTEMNRSGLVDAFVQIVDGTKIVGTRNMIISVESTVGDDSAIESSNSFTALASALIEVQSWNDRIDAVEQEFIDKANNLDATYPTRLVSVETALEQAKADLQAGMGALTVDAEVVTARSSAVTGVVHTVLDNRLEAIEIAESVMATNVVQNGDFASGITGWSAIGGTIRAVNGQLILNEGATSAEHYAQTDLSTPLLNTVYYFRGSSSNGATISLYNRKSDGSYESLSRPFVGGVASGRITTSTIFATPSMFVRVHGKTGVYLGANLEYLFDNVMVLNLTAIFGSGNEPTSAQMDRLLTQFSNSWFSGTKNLFLAKSALNELRKLDNDIVGHVANVSNPHFVTKVQIGLGNVDNTSDLSKPISTLTQAAITAHTGNVSNPHGVTKTQVGLSNVDNTSDANKPISTAAQTALNLKANKTQEAWITPTLVNGATGTFQYRKNDFGRLEFKGELTQASTASFFCITIAGYRPPTWIRCPISSIDGVVSMLVFSDAGALYLHTPLAGKTISFSGISINIQ